MVVVLAMACRRWLNPNPLANGRIPAADISPDQHWNRILQDDAFVRTMTQHLAGVHTNRQVEIKSLQRHLEHDRDINIVLGRVDFGGVDGHVAENGDWNDLEYVRGTRCSTTRSAVTAYFCGADIASNQNVGLERNQRKGYNFGVQSFADFIACRHAQGERRRGNKTAGAGSHHRRSVYRIGIGCQDSLAGYSHAFSIIAQPDGTFYWLQSFIGHYSLQKWMMQNVRPTDDHGKHGIDNYTPQVHLSLDELLGKLQQVKRLMQITGWTEQANTDYYELFGVDKEKEAMDRAKPPVRSTWKADHRLETFVWDEACEYPVPSSATSTAEQSVQNENDNSQEEGKTENMHDTDECIAPLLQNLLQQLKDSAGLIGSIHADSKNV